jgi:hypothetical protein
MTGAQLLVVSNEATFRDETAAYMEVAGHRVVAQAGSTAEALRHIGRENPAGYDFSAVVFERLSTWPHAARQPIDHEKIVNRIVEYGLVLPVLYHQSIPAETVERPQRRVVPFSGYVSLLQTLQKLY